MYQKIFLLSCLAIACNAQVPFWGQCPPIPPKINFDPTLFLGKWYEAEKYFTIRGLTGKCGAVTYSSLFPAAMRSYNQQLNVFTNVISGIEGTALLVSGPTVGILTTVFTGYPSVSTSQYVVLETDYTTFSIIFSCVNLNFLHLRYVWILTRARNPTPDVMTRAYSLMDTFGLPRGYLLKSDQWNCPIDH